MEWSDLFDHTRQGYLTSTRVIWLSEFQWRNPEFRIELELDDY